MKHISVTNLVKKKNLCNNKYKQKGERIHNLIEQYLKTNSLEVLNTEEEKIINQVKNFLNFFQEDKLIEIKGIEKDISYIYNGYQINGRIDLFLYDSLSKNYYIIDWKISKDITFINYDKIEKSMNMYKYIISKSLNIRKKYIEMYIVLIYEDNNEFILDKIHNLSKISINNILKLIK